MKRAIFVFLAMASCSARPPKPAAAPLLSAPLGGVAAIDVAGLEAFAVRAGGPQAQPITGAGENFDPSFSPDGEHILFISRGRALHANAQVYEAALKSRVERRVSFHDGDDASPSYRPDGARALYASTTDEIKEERYLVRALGERYAGAAPAAGEQARPYELYLSSVRGDDVARLTRSAGSDSEGRFDPQGKRIAFSSSRGGDGPARTRIFLMNAASGSRAIALTDGDDGAPAFSPDGSKIAFSRRAPSSATAQIFLVDSKPGSIARPLTTAAAINVSPAWTPDGREIAFASNRGDGKTFDLWTATPDGACLKRVTDAPGNETQPTFSRDGRAAFVSDRSGRKQIYVMPWSTPAACAAETP